MPPELADPLAHIRPLEGTSETVEVPDLLAEADARPGERCEILRVAAYGGRRDALMPLVDCLRDRGEMARARAVALAHDVPLPAPVDLPRDGLGELDEVALNAALEADPADARAWALLGAEYERQGRDAEAVEAFVEARRLDAG